MSQVRKTERIGSRSQEEVGKVNTIYGKIGKKLVNLLQDNKLTRKIFEQDKNIEK